MRVAWSPAERPLWWPQETGAGATSMTDGETGSITLQVFCSVLRVIESRSFGCSLWVIQG